MEYKERIALYLSGFADKETETQTENALLADAGLLEALIQASEPLTFTAPPGLAASVMRSIQIRTKSLTPFRTPVLSRKMCALVCFCSAAAIVLFTVSGAGRQVSDFVFSHSGRLNELLNALKFS